MAWHKAALLMEARGWGFLTQQRLEEGGFAYRFTRRGRELDRPGGEA